MDAPEEKKETLAEELVRTKTEAVRTLATPAQRKWVETVTKMLRKRAAEVKSLSLTLGVSDCQDMASSGAGKIIPSQLPVLIWLASEGLKCRYCRTTRAYKVELVESTLDADAAYLSKNSPDKKRKRLAPSAGPAEASTSSPKRARSDDNMCVACTVVLSETILKPCDHKVLCFACLMKWKEACGDTMTCPLCRKIVAEVWEFSGSPHRP